MVGSSEGLEDLDLYGREAIALVAVLMAGGDIVILQQVCEALEEQRVLARWRDLLGSHRENRSRLEQYASLRDRVPGVDLTQPERPHRHHEGKPAGQLVNRGRGEAGREVD